MKLILQIFNIVVISALLTSCIGSTAGLWGTLSTPTPRLQTTLTPSQTPSPYKTPTPSLSPSPSITPLDVIPMPGSITPSLTATEPMTSTITTTPTITATSTITTTPTATHPMRLATIPVDTATLPPVNPAGPMNVYTVQGGDTLDILAKRFGLLTEQIIAAEVLPPADELIPPGTLLLVPKPAANDIRSPSNQIIPDCEFVYGPTAIGFNTQDYVNKQHGYLANHLIDSGSEGKSAGAQAIERIALENSLSPRVILAIIEWESHWVQSQPIAPPETEYPLGFFDYHYRGLFRQLMWATATLSAGYYNWRSGALNELVFTDGTKLRLSPYLNAGSVAIQYYFSKTHTRAEWDKIIAPSGFAALYEGMFGPTWERAQYYEPTLTYGLVQPELSLPFTIGHVWAFTGGPHAAWEEDGAPAALDFAPSAQKNGCFINDAWVLAPAGGKVVRVGPGLVMLDLDGDGLEQTGWVIMFMHIRSDDKVELGQVLQKDDPIGHASCEGGVATGTHIHIARKYNGEWILADGPLAFNLDGWIAHNGTGPYKGSLTRNGQTVKACTCSTFETNIIREK